MRPDNLQIIGGSESLNTTRTEVAPGSNIVRKNFQGHWLWHIASCSQTKYQEPLQQLPPLKPLPLLSCLSSSRVVGRTLTVGCRCIRSI